MLVFIVLLLSTSVGARVEIDDTIHISKIPKRVVDLEEKLKVQERINEEQGELIRRLFEIINKDHVMSLDTENHTNSADDKNSSNREHILWSSNNVQQYGKRSHEEPSNVNWNRIQRYAAGLCKLCLPYVN
jgi:hypothetical protein